MIQPIVIGPQSNVKIQNIATGETSSYRDSLWYRFCRNQAPEEQGVQLDEVEHFDKPTINWNCSLKITLQVWL